MNISEIASDVFRFSLFVPEADRQFNQFLIRDDEPLLFHTGIKAIFSGEKIIEVNLKIIEPNFLNFPRC